MRFQKTIKDKCVLPQSSENFEGYYIGVMTGTSGDGLDIALVNIERNQGLQFVAAETVPFSEKLREKLISKLAKSDVICLQDVNSLDRIGRFTVAQSLYNQCDDSTFYR